MSGKEQGVLAAVSGDDVAVAVSLHVEPQLFEASGEVLRDLVFVVGRAVDGHQVDEGADQSVSVNHLGSPNVGMQGVAEGLRPASPNVSPALSSLAQELYMNACLVSPLFVLGTDAVAHDHGDYVLLEYGAQRLGRI